MKVPGQNGANVGTADSLSKRPLVPQLKNVEQRHMAGQRRMMHRENRAERGRLRENLP